MLYLLYVGSSTITHRMMCINQSISSYTTMHQIELKRGVTVSKSYHLQISIGISFITHASLLLIHKTCSHHIWILTYRLSPPPFIHLSTTQSHTADIQCQQIIFIPLPLPRKLRQSYLPTALSCILYACLSQGKKICHV